MNVRTSRMGTVITCSHRYKSNVTGKLKDVGGCVEKFVSASVPSVVEKQAVAAGWKIVRYPGGKECFCPEHTRKAIAERERAKRERNTERVWK